LRRLACLGGGTPLAWWFTILAVGPLLGSFITEPAAMTICALLLGRQFYDLEPSSRLKYVTLGLLFVNVSIGGTLMHFAAPPVLIVARTWAWDTPFMASHFGWRAAAAIPVSNLGYLALFRRELVGLSTRPAVPEVERPDDDAAALPGTPLLPLRGWVTIAHALSMARTVVTAHYPALFVGGFLFFLGFVRATAPYQTRIDLRSLLLVGFFLAGLLVHGGLQGWWTAPVLASLSEQPLFFGAMIWTAVNDNALITYLATLVPNLGVPENRRGRRCSNGWGLDRHRQRTQSRRSGAALAVLRGHDFALATVARGDPPHHRRHRDVSAALTNRSRRRSCGGDPERARVRFRRHLTKPSSDRVMFVRSDQTTASGRNAAIPRVRGMGLNGRCRWL
jgi:hypothetical protein